MSLIFFLFYLPDLMDVLYIDVHNAGPLKTATEEGPSSISYEQTFPVILIISLAVHLVIKLY